MAYKKKKSKKIGTMDIILIFVFIVLLIFTAAMIYLYINYQSIPETLCSCVFATLGGECGIMGWIKTNKDKAQERQWQKEDIEKEKDNGKKKQTNDNSGDFTKFN